jgi:hypothetical protein
MIDYRKKERKNKTSNRIKRRLKKRLLNNKRKTTTAIGKKLYERKRMR